jgi:Tfp pilus assembly PilM family ATPase
MLFLSKKTRGFFIDISREAVLMARTSSSDAPMVIEEMREIPVADQAAVENAVKDLQGKRAGGYLHACCGVYPSHRLVRRVTLDLKRIKEPEYFREICTQQFRMEEDKCTIAVLNAADGTDYDAGKATTQKEVIFTGGANDELLAVQERLLALGIFPERLELGTLAVLGAMANYHGFAQLKTPTLMLEMDADSTQSFVIGAGGLDVSRSIPHGFEAMISVVQKELNLKDEESARKLFYSNTFDFTNMGGLLTRKVMKELQSLIGFYEVQTGQSIGHVLCTQMPPKLAWLGGAIAKEMGVELLKVDFADWLKSHEISFASSVEPSGLDARWLAVFGLMTYYDAVPAAKK